MAFLHKETTWTIKTLCQVWEKSQYTEWETITWHLKPYSLEDQTFDPSWIDWSLFKMTIKWTIDISSSDQVVVWNDTYVVKVVKYYKWINFDTTKILLAI